MDDPLLTTDEVAAVLRLSRRTLEDWRLDDRGPEYVRLPKRVLYRRSAVLAWLSAQTIKTGESA